MSGRAAQAGDGFDDPAGRTRFAWARTLLVTLVVSLVVERLFFSDSPFSIAVLALPSVTMGIITVLRSRPLRNDPRGFETWIPLVALFSVMLVAAAALFGVVQSS